MDLSKIAIFKVISERLNWLGRRQEVLAHNVANANTPNFRPSDIAEPDFEKILHGLAAHQKMRVNDPRHVSRPFAQDSSIARGILDSRHATINGKFEETPNGNAVALEDQLMKVGENAMDFRMTANLYGKHLALIKAALGDPKK